jgi:hypothetical protein
MGRIYRTRAGACAQYLVLAKAALSLLTLSLSMFCANAARE